MEFEKKINLQLKVFAGAISLLAVFCGYHQFVSP